jgi:hypothetical protein
MKHKRHDKILNNFEEEKRKKLKRIADQSLKTDEKNNKLKEKQIKPNFLDKF